MSFDPMSAGLAVRLTHAHVTSARPDAPVVAPVVRRSAVAWLRARLATDLHAIARRVEPRRRPASGACQPG